MGTISTRRRKRRSGPRLIDEPCTSELWNITISPGSSTKSISSRGLGGAALLDGS